MKKKMWAMLVAAVLVLCPVAMACTFTGSASVAKGDSVLFDPEGEGGDDPTPDGVSGNDPEHPI